MSSMSVWLRLAAVGMLIAMIPHAAAAKPAGAGAARLTARADGIEARRGALLMRVTALTDAVLRVRIARNGTLPEDASWAVARESRLRSVPVRRTADGFATAGLRVHLGPDLRLRVEDEGGRTIVADDAEPIRFDGRGFILRKFLPRAEHIFGLGDKTGPLDRRGGTFVDWNTDAYAFTRATDPLYKSIPFFIGVGGPGGSYGILLDNSWRGWFDFGHRDPEVTSFGAPDGPIDYYILAGPSTAEVVRRYTDLTGKAPLAPLWSLGYQQSRYSYMSAEEVRTLAERLRRERMPTDVVWLDIDFQDRNRPFTVDRKAFPDLKGLAGDLGRQGIRLVAITDLHVARAPGQGYAPYDSGLAGNRFVHNPDGSVYVGKVWPGDSVFPDFTDAGARAWWGGLFRPLVDAGIAGIWNDMNEPSVFETPNLTMPLDAVHRIAGDDFAPRAARHAEVHNIYGMENNRATYEGLRALSPDERAFVMTRASYAGGQRYAVTWTGDNGSTWDHLALSIHQLINLGLSGFSYAAADVGGYTGGPSPELMTRWFEIAAFTPVFRDHSAKGTPRAEPWVDGPEQLAIRRRFVEQRYRLLPYLYALADQNARTGDPIMRPVFYDYPAALATPCDQSMAFTLGKALLIAPPPKPESPQAYEICLPAGGWYDLWTGRAVTGGAGTAPFDIVRETPRLDRLPVYVRAGTILPSQPLVQSTGEVPKGPLTLDIYPGEDCGGTIYLDDGHSMAFQRGAYLRQRVTCRLVAPGRLEIELAPSKGSFVPWWHEISVRVHGWAGPAAVSSGRATVASDFDAPANLLHFELPAMAAGGRIVIG
ncbi:MAG: alpha-glucosidase [Alphaproteobacteria bacterium]|nr:alpha-glucosidase [Alphaproteobacteria bacterium]